MKKNMLVRGTFVGATLVAGVLLAGCSPNGHTDSESFEFAGDTLNVVHNNSHMNVSVSSGAGDEVVVEVTTQTAGQEPEVPAWSLSDGILNLGTPCGGSVVGYCEGSYSVKVPEGTEVLVNGQPVAVG